MQIKYDREASNMIEEASILVFKRFYVMQISLVKHIKTALVSMVWGHKPTHLDSFLIIIKSFKVMRKESVQTSTCVLAHIRPNFNQC